jgi:tetratricopeptide (TPR) repeat protein
MMLKGETWHAPGHAGMLSFIKTELGDFRTAQKCCDKFQEIADLYEDDHHKARISTYYTKLLLRSGKLYELLDETEKMILLNNKIGQRLTVIFLLGIKANAQILLKDLDGADSSLQRAKELVSHEKRISPLMISSYLMSQLLLNLCKLEMAIDSGDKLKIKQYRKEAIQFGREALKNSKKFAAERTKTPRLMGVYFWLIGKQEKAFTWWKRSIKNGEELDARPELARTYMEIGCRLLAAKNRSHQLDGISADEYLGKARRLFVELGIESDLNELDMMLSQRP